MRLALCLEYPIQLRGGVSVLVDTLLRGLIQRGHQVVLVSPDTPESLNNTGLANVVQSHIRWNPQQSFRLAARELAAQLAQANIDLAHFHSGGNYGWGNRFPYQSPIVFLGRLGVPCVSTVHLVLHLFDGFCGPQRPAWFKLLLLPIAWWGKVQQLRNVRYEIAVSQQNWRKLRRWYWPFRKRFVQIYHSRLDTQTPAPIVEREAVILNVGHIAPHKGQEILARAFARIAAVHPQWTLQFAGQDEAGDSVERITNFAKEHGLSERIVLLGERSDALNLMQRAGIYVQPSLWEAFGLALQEAMFCGCAVIGSRVGGIPELIQDGRTGVLCESGDVTQLSNALDELIRDQARRASLGTAAAASIRERGMTLQTMMERHLELYESVLAEK